MCIIRALAIVSCLALLSISRVEADEIGDEHEEAVFNIRTGHGWDGFPDCNPHSGSESKAYLPPSGYALVSQRWASNSSHNGWTRIDVGDGGPSFPSISSINNQFGLLTALARATKNTDAAREIDEIKDHWVNARANITQKNSMTGIVWAGADGNCGDRKDGWQDSNFYATIRKIGSEEQLSSLIANLKRKYFPDL